MTDQTKGKCELCGQEYAKAGMSRHLASCLKRHIAEQATPKNPRTFLLLTVTAPGNPAYWLHLLADSDSDLGSLDNFLRNIWLECCGHLSAFSEKGTYGLDEIEMSMSISQALSPGNELGYEYDFGSTTELRIKSLDAYSAPPTLFESLALLARNQPPVIPCSVCGKPTVRVCSECIWEGTGWLCGSCAKRHAKKTGCDSEAQLPVVNSPRTGVCAYCG